MSSIFNADFVRSPFVGRNEPVTGSVVSGSTTYVALSGPGNYTLTANCDLHWNVGYLSGSFVSSSFVPATPTAVVKGLPTVDNTWRSGSVADFPLTSGEKTYFNHKESGIDCGLVLYGLEGGTVWVLKS